MNKELIIEWFNNLIDEEIETEEGTISNEECFADGSDEDAYDMHISNIESHREYIEFLKNIKEEAKNIL